MSRLTETVTWRNLVTVEPAHGQLCVVILSGEGSPRVLKYINDPDLGAPFWEDPHRSGRDWWEHRTEKYDQWAPAPMAPVAPPVAVAS